jgi:hypothetical protein
MGSGLRCLDVCGSRWLVLCHPGPYQKLAFNELCHRLEQQVPFFLDMPDGGAEHIAKTVSYLKERYLFLHLSVSFKSL